MRDTHPLNMLGQGVIDPAHEAWIVGRGCVFATLLPPDRKGHRLVISSRRPYADVLNDRTSNRTTRTLSIVEG